MVAVACWVETRSFLMLVLIRCRIIRISSLNTPNSDTVKLAPVVNVH
jgi:hypothetical protein